MKKILKKFLDSFKNDASGLSNSKEISNKEIIDIYNELKENGIIPKNEPNYSLAQKVFLEFNDFNLKNIEKISHMYLGYIPRSLLPYPKNYIKCAYYIFLESLEKKKDFKNFKLVQNVGVHLFFDYPDYNKYQENLKHKAMYDDIVFKDGNPLNGHIPREEFRKLYGSYQISKEEYDSSPSSIDSTNEKLINDFGVLQEIEEDVDFDKIHKERNIK